MGQDIYPPQSHGVEMPYFQEFSRGRTMADNKAKTKVKSMTKSEVLQHLADETKLTKKQVQELFSALEKLIGKELKKKDGVFTIPGLLKLRVVRKGPTKAGTRPNPFKPGEMMEVKAKPAKNTVRARPLKTLNELVK
jgi:nucleoid DNA-binding protein